ncbi:hypothetical protein NQ317_005933 [Molorchus minor]|uniref:Uncharacterized protein n=1 Tax=Molorchus minor TaxID=1323400 RepID=A0ABQ9JAR7_9CUCU|nr:hypothetical protein NQ317_005933 [Molorchus minor]
MVAPYYFYNYFVLLVLQSAVFIHCQNPFDSFSTTLRNFAYSTTVPDEPKNSSAASGGAEEVTEAPLIINLDTSQVVNNSTNITNTSTIFENSEFPESPEHGQKIYCANETLQVPLLNVTANSSRCQDGKINPNITISKQDLNDTKISNIVNTDSEVPDMLNNSVIKQNVSDISDKPPRIDVDENIINKETELIEDGENTEDILRGEREQEQLVKKQGAVVVQGQLAAILAGVFVIVSILVYLGLLSWRRYLENRYGSRQILINEDELNDRDDLRHFSI